VAATVDNFKTDLRRFDRKLVGVLEEVHVETTRFVRARVATKTPILTGRASASWNASIGQPNFTPQPVGFFNPGGAPFAGKIALTGYRLGQQTYVANGVGYIGSLNMGSSFKAPAGFAEATVTEVNGALLAIVAEVRRRVKI